MSDYETVEFTTREIAKAEQFAERHARVDEKTRDPENVIMNKAASRLSEIAAIDVLKTRGLSPIWKDEDVTRGDEAPYDIEADGERIDVKCRRSADDGRTANLMPTKGNIQRAGSTFDGWIMVWVAPDLSEARVYGAASVEFFAANSETFFGISPPRDRLAKADLQPVGALFG